MNRRHLRNRIRKTRRYFEALESRQLMSAAFHPIWRINGTAADDVISVIFNSQTQAFDLTINGTAAPSHPLRGLRQIVIQAGAGNDSVTIDTGGKKIRGVIHGGEGNDALTGGEGNDVIYGGAGDNVIYGGNGNDTLLGGPGNDSISGGAGNDLLNGGAGIDTLNGGAGNDTLRGAAGDDTLNGGTGNDTLDGNAGNDALDGNAGNDRLFGRVGDDTLVGGLGNDYMDGGGGENTIYAATHADRFVFRRRDSIIRAERPVAASVTVGDNSDDGDSGDDGVTALPPVAIGDELKQRLIEEAVTRYQQLFGTTYTWYPYHYYDGPSIVVRSDITVMSSTASAPVLNGATSDYSSTNTQVQGVDEADLVETDGNFIYTIRNNQLVVIDVRDPAKAQIAATVDLAGQVATGLYLVNGRVVVLTQGSLQRLDAAFRGRINYNNYQSQTTVWLFNVTDPAAPAFVEKTTVTGNLVASRMIDNQLYLVMGNDLTMPPPRSTQTASTTDTTTDNSGTLIAASSLLWYRACPSVTYQYETEDEYRQWLTEHIEEYLPTAVTTLADGTAGPAASLLGNIAFEPVGATLGATTSILSFDVADDTSGPAALTTAVGTPKTVYVSNHNLYVFTERPIESNSSQPALIYRNGNTDILKFNLNNHSITFDAAGHVDGTPLNSYALDEYNGQLRVVTEDWSTGTLKHALYVLSDIDDTLTVTGTLTGIGDGESLRAVRFMGDRAFVVTFQNIDPLFTIDLSDPENPTNLGVLEIPGFSTYLYPIDADHLIGIGRGSIDNPSDLHHVQISLFDVSDLEHPAVVEQMVLASSDWINSNTLYDPHAFAYYADEGVMAIPLATEIGGYYGSCANELLVMQVDPTDGFMELGRVKQNSEVLRSLRIGDNLYSFSTTDLKIVELMQPDNVIANVVLPGSTGPEVTPSGGILRILPVFTWSPMMTIDIGKIQVA